MSTPRRNQKRALLLVLCLTALSPGAALAGEKLLGTITSNGSSVNNLTAAVPFTLPSTVQTGGSRLALQCSTPAHYALGVDSSAAATTSDFLVNTELVLDVLGASVVAVRNDSASSTCRVFASSAPSRSSASGSSSGAVTGGQGPAAAKAGAWPMFLTDGGLGTSSDPVYEMLAPIYVQPQAADGGLVQGFALAATAPYAPQGFEDRFVLEGNDAGTVTPATSSTEVGGQTAATLVAITCAANSCTRATPSGALEGVDLTNVSSLALECKLSSGTYSGGGSVEYHRYIPGELSWAYVIGGELSFANAGGRSTVEWGNFPNSFRAPGFRGEFRPVSVTTSAAAPKMTCRTIACLKNGCGL